jgi:DHA3 family macrolide efflux protein-like MFS transporter
MSTKVPNPVVSAPGSADSSPMSMGAVLRIPFMRHLWYAQIISVFGDFLALYAVISYFTFKLNATAQQITGVQISFLLPIAVLGFLAGVFVDRWPLKTTMVTSDLVRSVLVLGLLFSTRFWHFYAALAAISIISAFFGPAQGVALRIAVPIRGLSSANSLMQQVMLGMRIVGPPVAVFLVEWVGAKYCYVIDSASFIGSACLIGAIAFVRPQDTPAGFHPAVPVRPEGSALHHVWIDMREGFAFIVKDPSLFFVIAALAFGMFVIGCFAPLTALYVRDNLHASNKIFGIASALVGLGMVIGINVLNIFAKNVKNSILVYCGLAGIGVGLLLLAGIVQLWASFVAEFVIGFAFAGIFIPSETTIQKETPPHLMGRVGSTVASTIYSAQISGLVLSGILAQYVGVRQVFVGCAVLLALLILAGRLWMEPKGTTATATA